MKSATSNLFNCNILQKKQKFLNLEPKKPYLGILDWNLEKNIVIHEISVLEFVLQQSLVQNLKSLNLKQKMSDLGIFGLEFENDTVIFEISTLEFV